jgi:hypothetical protein
VQEEPRECSFIVQPLPEESGAPKREAAEGLQAEHVTKAQEEAAQDRHVADGAAGWQDEGRPFDEVLHGLWFAAQGHAPLLWRVWTTTDSIKERT